MSRTKRPVFGNPNLRISSNHRPPAELVYDEPSKGAKSLAWRLNISKKLLVLLCNFFGGSLNIHCISGYPQSGVTTIRVVVQQGFYTIYCGSWLNLILHIVFFAYWASTLLFSKLEIMETLRVLHRNGDKAISPYM